MKLYTKTLPCLIAVKQLFLNTQLLNIVFTQKYMWDAFAYNDKHD